MISDEMRELLSAYVDGELRDSDAARVEDLSKRDPELRREIEAYRRLGTRLRDWDDAEHGTAPPPGVMRRALARARTFVAAGDLRAPGRVVRLFAQPAVAAAALLLAAGAGLLLAQWGADRPVVERFVAEAVHGGDPVAPPLETLRLDAPAVPPLLDPDPGWSADRPDFYDVLVHHLENSLVDGEPISDRARALREEMLLFEQQTQRRKKQYAAAPAERRTRAWNTPVAAVIGRYSPVAAPYRGLVLVSHPQVRSELPRVGAVPVGARIALDPAGPEENVLVVSAHKLPRDVSRLGLLGEVWTGVEDRSRRTRILAASGWIRDVESFPMVWADRIGRPEMVSHRLELQPVVLGPQARRRLLAGGTGDEFRAFLGRRYASGPLDKYLAAGVVRSKAACARLVRELEADLEATGFVVLAANGAVLGAELFASHELMVEFAPRLLFGYLIEAGERGIRLERERDGVDGKSPAVERVTRLFDHLPETTSLEETRRRDYWPRGMRAVRLRSASRAVIGYGLLLGTRPVQLSILGE